MEFHEKLKEVRKTLRYSQAAFAQLIGTDQRTVSLCERAKRTLSYDMICKYNEIIKQNKLKIKLFT